MTGCELGNDTSCPLSTTRIGLRGVVVKVSDDGGGSRRWIKLDSGDSTSLQPPPTPLEWLFGIS